MNKLTTRQRDRLIEAIQNAIEFTVTGSGQFPVDMLRYDRCWPASSTDAGLVADTGSRCRLDADHEGECDLGQRTVRLYGLKEPTAARWASFGWSVTP